MPFSIIRNDITKISADAIVNTANPQPIVGSGTDSAIYKAAGYDELLQARKNIGEIEPGHAVMTPAFNLNANYIIHTVGPRWIDGNHQEFALLKSCYENSLKLATQLKCKSIAFPLIASGSYHFPKDMALKVATTTFLNFLKENEIEIYLVIFDKESLVVSQSIEKNIQEFIDEKEVQKVLKKEYHLNKKHNVRFDIFRSNSKKHVASSEYIVDNTFSKTTFQESASIFESITLDPDERISEFIKKKEKTFQEKLFDYIDQKKLKATDVYRGYISKQVYSKIQNDKNYHPAKNTAIALCISLKLNMEETLDLIGRAGWTLSKSSLSDFIISQYILEKNYDIYNIDCCLYKYGCPTLVNNPT